MDNPRLTATARAAHWARTRNLSAALLAIWLVTGFGTVFYARELANYTLFGWPLSFYMAAQGCSLVSLVLIGCYAWTMRRLDRATRSAHEDHGHDDHHGHISQPGQTGHPGPTGQLDHTGPTIRRGDPT